MACNRGTGRQKQQDRIGHTTGPGNSSTLLPPLGSSRQPACHLSPTLFQDPHPGIQFPPLPPVSAALETAMTSMRDRLGFVADSSTSNPFCRAQARCPPAPSTSRQFCLAPFPSRAVRRDTVSPDFAAAFGCAPADADQEATSVHRPCQSGRQSRAGWPSAQPGAL